MNTNSKIAEFYQNKSIFFTGGTGFVGQGTIEKLLRSCPEISKLYLLIRNKAGQSIPSRLAKFLESTIFDTLRAQDPGALAKIIPMAGDIALPELGLSAEDQEILFENVAIVIHSAATVKFDEKLKSSININVYGTERIVCLCKQMKKLVALVHVSTAYANCDDKQVPESIRPLALDPHNIMESVNLLDDETVERITPLLIGNKPNTYTFTKALAENLLEKENGCLPICIVRPSIITATYKDPISGWINNINGPTGYIVAYGKGVLRSGWGRTGKIGDLIPLDYVVNLIIVGAWDVANGNPNSIAVYNCCTGPTNPMRWSDFLVWGKKNLDENPFSGILWYPSATSHRYRFTHRIFDACLHHFPAYLMDIVAHFAGWKPQMVNVYHKMTKAMTSFEYFTTREWMFENKNLLNLYDRMCPEDKISFTLNVGEINWRDYIKIYCSGVRKYILKDDPSSLPAARKHLRKMYWIDRFTKSALILLFWCILFRRFGTAWRLKAVIHYLLRKISCR